MSGAHRFSWITRPEENLPPRALDAELRSFPEAGVIMSLGSLVPGWLLVVPRTCTPNFRQLPWEIHPKLSSVVRCLVAELERFEGQVFAFEHGASNPTNATACGVEQAHLHVVPLPFDLLTAAEQHAHTQGLPFVPLGRPLDPWATIPAHGDYLLVQRAYDSAAALILPDQPLSQWFRRVIAIELHRSTEWDYRERPQIDNMVRTAAGLRFAI